MQIVLARLDEDQELVRRGRDDLGERHTFRTVAKPVSVMWTNAGTQDDLAKAQTYANKEGYRVFTYFNQPYPLEMARRDVSR